MARPSPQSMTTARTEYVPKSTPMVNAGVMCGSGAPKETD
jgi:hypothetical protein